MFNKDEFRRSILKYLYENQNASGFVSVDDLQLTVSDADPFDLHKEIKYLEGKGFVRVIDRTLWVDDDYSLEITSEGIDFYEGNNDTLQGITNIHINGFSNSNVTVNSKDIQQFIETYNVSDPEVKNKLKELHTAVSSKNKDKIIGILKWLGDKSLDTLLAIIIKGIVI